MRFPSDDQSAAERRPIAAMLTAPGRGAMAAVAVRGAGVLPAIAACCELEPKRLASACGRGRLMLTRWGGPDGEPVVLHVIAPDRVEITCHGGAMSVRAILHDLAARGVRTVAWWELTRSDAEDAIRAEAVESLASAPTQRTAAILLDQWHGALTDTVLRLRGWLRQSRVDQASSELRGLLARSHVGLHLTQAWRVAIVGRPNVGKSSLLNAIVGYDRAIVHPTAGTTRDVVTASTAVDGWPVEFWDSAGIRETGGELEAAGIERARRAILDSDAQLVVFDRSQPLAPEDHTILRDCARPIVVANKIDLPAGVPDSSALEGACLVSAHTGAGLPSLLARLSRLLVAEPPCPHAPLPFTARQVELIEAAERAVRSGDLVGADQALCGMLQ